MLADGKLYVGTENGKFYIIRPHADKAEVLDSDQLGTEGNPEPIIAAPAVARGRVYVVSMDGDVCARAEGHAAVGCRGGACELVAGAASGTRCW